MNSQEIIPIDSALTRFSRHLESHPRTILSAKFGDGKTFFLNEFAKNEQYKVIRVSPVNYQVVENDDIFALIKWDILLQFAINGILNIREENVSRMDALRYGLANHWDSLLEEGANVISEIPFPQINVLGLFAKGISGFIKVYKEVRKDYKSYLQGDDEKLEDMLKEIESTPLLECDLLSKLIQDSILQWKDTNPDKRIILVFDDMDRLDPAHLFRIMNIISAHMDYGNKYGIQNEDLSYCKFGFDNIVLVLHYQNLESIFHHLYGPHTDSSGYIRKFADKGHFEYSLYSESRSFFYNKLSEITKIDQDYLQSIINNDLLSHRSIRDLISSLDNIDSQIFLPEKLFVGKCSILKTIVVLKRLDVDFNGIQNIIRDSWRNNPQQFVRYFGYLIQNNGVDNGGIISNGIVEGGNSTSWDIKGFDQAGFAIVDKVFWGNRVPVFDVDRLISIVLSYVNN